MHLAHIRKRLERINSFHAILSREGLDRRKVLEEIGRLNLQGKSYSVKRSATVYQHMKDPALLRYYYRIKTQAITDKLDLQGSSPTDIFIGRHNYPKVFIGPMVPPEFGDTSVMGTPERWVHFTMDQIVDFRSRLVRGMHLTKVTDVESGKVQQQVKELALADRPADSEMHFLKKPFAKVNMRDEVQPFGPSAMMKDFEVYNVSANRKIENMHHDTDALAKTAIVELYDKGLEVSRIQKALSAGLFGLKTRRRFVPTRWSITAVDDTLSKNNLETVRSYDPVDAIYAFYNVALDNRWLIFFIPGNWQYESIEAWWPKTVWNEDGVNISIFGSYEGYNGRKNYAEIGGCYYSGRLAITEKMLEMKKQGVALILREVHEGYLMPVGVWNVREHVRQTLAMEPDVLHSEDQMFDYIKKKLDISIPVWIRNSRVLRDLLMQRRISSYVR